MARTPTRRKQARQWLLMDEPRRAAPATPEMVPLRRRAMVWSALAFVLVVARPGFSAYPVVTVVAYGTALYAFWLTYRYVRLQTPNDIAFWTPERIAAWETGERDMAAIAAIPAPVADHPPGLDWAPDPLPPLDPADLLLPDRPLHRRREHLP